MYTKPTSRLRIHRSRSSANLDSEKTKIIGIRQECQSWTLAAVWPVRGAPHALAAGPAQT
jgi:hypothetical protein